MDSRLRNILILVAVLAYDAPFNLKDAKVPYSTKLLEHAFVKTR